MGVGRLKKTKLLVDQLEDRRLMAVIDPDIVPHDGTDTSFVRNLYEDVLNRPADAGGEAYWVGKLAGADSNALSRFEVAEAFLASPEYVLNLVQEFYQDFLGRSATVDFDPITNSFTGPESFFFNHLYNGGNGNGQAGREEEVIVGIVSSQEYALIKGQTNEEFVTNLYADVLGRDPDAGGFDFFVARLNNGESRSKIATEFVNSPELHIKLLVDVIGDVPYYESWANDYFDIDIDITVQDILDYINTGTTPNLPPGVFDIDEAIGFFESLNDDAPWREVQAELLATDLYYLHPTPALDA